MRALRLTRITMAHYIFLINEITPIYIYITFTALYCNFYLGRYQVLLFLFIYFSLLFYLLRLFSLQRFYSRTATTRINTRIVNFSQSKAQRKIGSILYYSLLLIARIYYK